MRKFLLTLAALFTAGTALADCGFFFGTFDQSTLGSTNESTLVLTQEDLNGDEYVVLLGAYWSARVSGTECQITFPEGMHATFAEPGADLTVWTLNGRGNPASETAAVAGLTEPYEHWVTTFSTAGYYRDEDDNLVNYGINKWEAGYYDEMLIYYIQIDPDFTGGDIVVVTNVASGRDVRGGTVRENGEHAHSFTFTCHVTVDGTEPTPEPKIGIGNLGDYEDNEMLTIDYDATVLFHGSNRLFVKDETGFGLIYGSIDQTYEQGDVIPAGYSGKKTTYSGEPELTNPTGFQAPIRNEAVEAETATPLDFDSEHFAHYVVLHNVDIVELNGRNFTVIDTNGNTCAGYDQFNQDIIAGHYNELYGIVGSYRYPNTIYQLLPIIKEQIEPMDLTGEIMFGDMDENGTIPVWYEGPEEVTLRATINGESVEIIDGTITLPDYGTYEVYVYANAEGYKEESRMKVFTWEEPVVEQTPAPVVNFEMRGDQLWCVITGEGDIYVDGVNQGPAPVEFLVATQTAYDQDGSYMIYAIAEGKTQSETVRASWELPAKEVEYAEKPVITYNEETFTVTATSADNVVMFVDGLEVENPYTFEQQAEEKTYHVTAYAWADGKENSEYAEKEITVPAKEVEYTAVPVVTVEVTDDAYIFTATGDGEVTLYVDGVEVENPYTVARPETAPEEPYAVYVYATAQEEGKEMSQSEVQRVVIEAKATVEPVVTPTPEIIITETDDAIIINVNGEGEVHVYVNGEEVEVPYTIEKGNEAQTIVVTATAQGEDMEISETATQTVVVPAKASDDPHMVGHWLVLVDEDGNEEWVVLYQSANNPNNWVNMYTFHHQPWGPVVRYYFVVDGVRYGAPEDMQPTAMGPIEETVQNPLYETDFYYTIEGGFTYTLGMQDLGETKYVLCAQGGRVGVDETLAGKTIANVRYFNMAGQEMHEANGMTIVVTTYTDGTTSAVKVMQ